MSVNISSAMLPTRVGRPIILTAEIKQKCFPELQCDNGWIYFTVAKQHTSPPSTIDDESIEYHCLKVRDCENSDYVNEMLWYCKSCGKFPCQWRVRQRHLKGCNPNLHLSSSSSSHIRNIHRSKQRSTYIQQKQTQNQQRRKEELQTTSLSSPSLLLHSSLPFNENDNNNNGCNSNNVYISSSPTNSPFNNNMAEYNHHYAHSPNYQHVEEVNPMSPTTQWYDEIISDFSLINLDFPVWEVEQSFSSLNIEPTFPDHHLHHHERNEIDYLTMPFK